MAGHPVTVEMWAEPGHGVVWVTDRGRGLKDPFVGLLEPDGSAVGGRGLWIVHQLRTQVTLHHGADGFTVRLVA